MTEFTECYLSKYMPTQLFELVIDVEKYPSFIPWCSNVTIIEKNQDLIIADMEINFKGMRLNYRSEIKINIITADLIEIDIKATNGPFKYLFNKWTFNKLDSKTQIKFFIDFKFKSVILDKLLQIFFAAASKEMFKAFNNRAEELYG